MRKARVFNKGEAFGEDSQVERVFDAFVASRARVSRTGKSDGSNVLDGHLKWSSRILSKESRGSPTRVIPEEEGLENEKLPFDPDSRIYLSQTFMYVGAGKFARCVAEMVDRTSLNPTVESKDLSARFAPLWMGMLEITGLASSALENDTDRC